MIQHIAQSYRQRAVSSLYHHPKTVADQQDIDSRLVEDSCEGIIVGRQHRDWRSCGLHPCQVSYTDFFLCHTSRPSLMTASRCARRRLLKKYGVAETGNPAYLPGRAQER